MGFSSHGAYQTFCTTLIIPGFGIFANRMGYLNETSRYRIFALFRHLQYSSTSEGQAGALVSTSDFRGRAPGIVSSVAVKEVQLRYQYRETLRLLHI